MKFLIFDTETTGLPKRGARLPKVDMYPYIIQISWLVFDDSIMRITNINNHLIKLPDGMSIPQESTNIHGVTNSITAEGTLNVNKNNVVIKAKFSVKLEDYNIDIPKIVMYNIAEVIDVDVEIQLDKYEG